MRTVGDLAAVTGVDINTVKYYARPHLPKSGRTSYANDGKRVKEDGAGFLNASSTSDNGVRGFDEDQLMKLYLIKVLRKSGVEQKEIRSLLERSQSIDAVMQKGLERIEQQELLLQNQKRNLLALQQFASTDDVDDVLNDILPIAMAEMMERALAKYAEMRKGDPELLSEWRERNNNRAPTIADAKGEELVDLILQGATIEQLEQKQLELADSYESLEHAEDIENFWVSISSLIDAYEKGGDFASDEVQSEVELARKHFSAWMPPSLFEWYVQLIFNGNIFAVGLDYGLEGCWKWVLKAVKRNVTKSGGEATIG